MGARAGSLRIESTGWLLLACAVMVKGPVALLLVVLFGMVAWIAPSSRPLVRNLHWRSGIPLVALLAAPWFVYMASVYKGQFLRNYLLAGNLWYFTRPAAFSNRASDSLFYARTYLGACFPWSLLAIGAAVDWWRTGGQPRIEERTLWIWTFVVLGFFSIAGFKLDTYILPAVPTTCLLAAASLSSARRGISATAVAVWITVATLVIGGAVLAATMFRIDLGLTAVAALVPAALIAGGIVAAARMRHLGPAGTTGALMATLLVVYAVVVVEGFPILERSRPTAPIGRWIDRHAPPDAPIGVDGSRRLARQHPVLYEASHRRAARRRRSQQILCRTPRQLHVDAALRCDRLPGERCSAAADRRAPCHRRPVRQVHPEAALGPACRHRTDVARGPGLRRIRHRSSRPLNYSGFDFDVVSGLGRTRLADGSVGLYVEMKVSLKLGRSVLWQRLPCR